MKLDLSCLFESILASLKRLENKMATLDDVKAAVTALEAESAKENTLLGQIYADLQAALANQASPTDLQAIVDRLGVVVSGQQAAEAAAPPPA